MKVVFEELGTKLDWIGMRSNQEKRGTCKEPALDSSWDLGVEFCIGSRKEFLRWEQSELVPMSVGRDERMVRIKAQ